MTGKELLDRLNRFADEQLSYEIVVPDGSGDLRRFRNMDIFSVREQRLIVAPVLSRNESVTA